MILVFNLDNINHKRSDVPHHLHDEKIEILIQSFGDLELQFSEELWHNLWMCSASAVHGGMFFLQVVSSGEGCVVITETQTPFPMTVSFLCYFHMPNSIGGTFAVCREFLIRELDLGAVQNFLLVRVVFVKLKRANALNL